MDRYTAAASACFYVFFFFFTKYSKYNFLFLCPVRNACFPSSRRVCPLDPLVGAAQLNKRLTACRVLVYNMREPNYNYIIHSAATAISSTDRCRRILLLLYHHTVIRLLYCCIIYHGLIFIYILLSYIYIKKDEPLPRDLFKRNVLRLILSRRRLFFPLSF